MATSLTTKIASLIAAFGVAIGAYKVVEATQVDPSGAVRILPRDDGHASGMASSNPFGITHRPITDDDHLAKTATNIWLDAAQPAQTLSQPPAAAPNADALRIAREHYTRFLANRARPGLSSISAADDLISILWTLGDFRNMTLLGGAPDQFLRDLRHYSVHALATSKTQMRTTADPVDKFLLHHKIDDYLLYARVDQDGHIGALSENGALQMQENSAAKLALLSDVLRISGQRITTSGDVTTMTAQDAGRYIHDVTAIKRAMILPGPDGTEILLSPDRLLKESGISAGDWHKIDSNVEFLREHHHKTLSQTPALPLSPSP